ERVGGQAGRAPGRCPARAVADDRAHGRRARGRAADDHAVRVGARDVAQAARGPAGAAAAARPGRADARRVRRGDQALPVPAGVRQLGTGGRGHDPRAARDLLDGRLRLRALPLLGPRRALHPLPRDADGPVRRRDHAPVHHRHAPRLGRHLRGPDRPRHVQRLRHVLHAPVLPLDTQGARGGRHDRRGGDTRHLRPHRPADHRAGPRDPRGALVHGVVEQLPVAAPDHQRPRPHDPAPGPVDAPGHVPGADPVEHRDGRDRDGHGAHDPRLPPRPALGHRGRGRFRGQGVMAPGKHGPPVDASDRDLAALLAAQLPNGAYPAAAGFSQYGPCWLRDGSFIAHATDLAGRHDSAARFHAWVARTVAAQAGTVGELLARRRAGEPISESDFLPTRYAVDGEWVKDGGPNCQLDGYGQWLWSLAGHLAATGQDELPAHLAAGVDVVVDYLSEFWDEPCYDCWEEFRSQLHTATLGSVAAGMGAIARWVPRAAPVGAAARELVLTGCVVDGRFVKHVGNPEADASLTWLCTPFGLVADDDPVMRATVARIEADLVVDGGTSRYRADTYYGGGE